MSVSQDGVAELHRVCRFFASASQGVDRCQDLAWFEWHAVAGGDLSAPSIRLNCVSWPADMRGPV